MHTMLSVQVFIDWDSARRAVGRNASSKENVPLQLLEQQIESAYSMLREKLIEFLLEKTESKCSVKIVGSRIYHGWHRGKTATRDREAWENVSRKLKPIVRQRISFLPEIRFGNELLCQGKRMPLYDTLRERHSKGRDAGLEQKMVDTALVSDLLSFSRSESKNIKRGIPPPTMAIVIGDDDDLLPGVFTAEAWGLPVFVLSRRPQQNKHLISDGLIHGIQSDGY